MRTGRNLDGAIEFSPISLDHWDMRTGRNLHAARRCIRPSLDHWDMRTGRNSAGLMTLRTKV